MDNIKGGTVAVFGHDLLIRESGIVQFHAHNVTAEMRFACYDRGNTNFAWNRWHINCAAAHDDTIDV